MTMKEKKLIVKAIEFIRSDDGYEQGMRILYDLIGNKSYGKFLDMMGKGRKVTIFDILKKGG